MAPPKSTKKTSTQKKEKLFHPQSRKAEQLARVQNRKGKLAELAKARIEKQRLQADIHSFFYNSLQPEGVLSLEELHAIVKDVWLARFDSDLEEERATRRKGRPKSAKEQRLEELKLREAEEYRTGLEVVDLTHPPNVKLFRRWDQKEVAFIQQLRLIRISSDSPDTIIVSRPGQHISLLRDSQTNQNVAGQAMDLDTDTTPLLLEPPSRFASTIATMDGTT
ncbi:uncharacterized protein FIBRA_04546 [Fibroporia radiculosa]|uniref:Translation machinery-associated protein 16 n=1 Tax=Fibroporia radiculosa TaxID=599839 RepID=J4HWL0_9APHY|nr:uncharacterized protein FIBRA_04546 [Fibroporia radiculosa]CCM02447.1 predicted protein [Fibroporia radiculosa]